MVSILRTKRQKEKVVTLVQKVDRRPEGLKTVLQSTNKISLREHKLQKKKRTTKILRETETESC